MMKLPFERFFKFLTVSRILLSFSYSFVLGIYSFNKCFSLFKQALEELFSSTEFYLGFALSSRFLLELVIYFCIL